MDTYRKYLKIVLPALFMAYLGCLIAFTHVHIVNGVTIVHSHPYHKNADGTPKEEHTIAEFQLHHQISTILTTGTASATLLLAALTGVVYILICRPVYPVHLRPILGKLSLRAPPVSLY